MITIDEVLKKQQDWQALPTDDESVVGVFALESLSKCSEAMAVLSENLKNIGYVWVYSERIPDQVIKKNVRLIETETGFSIPRVLVSFWRLVGGISLVDLRNYRHVDFWKDNGISTKYGFTDGLHVDACTDEWASFICDDYLDWKEFAAPDESEDFLLSLSPDGYHKDKISGGAPYGVLSGSTWKPIWQNFEWSGVVRPVTALAGPPDFLSYLRTTILECAGFPALLGVPAFDSMKEKILRGVPVF
jgi:hypothetical protein